MARKAELNFIDGELVQKRLAQLGIAQKALADKLEISERHLSRCLRNNEMTKVNILRISEITNLSVDELTDSQFELLGERDNLQYVLMDVLKCPFDENAKYHRTRTDELFFELRTKKVKYNGKEIPYTELLFHLILQFCGITEYEFETYPKDSISPYMELIKLMVDERIIKPHQKTLTHEQLEMLNTLDDNKTDIN